MAIFETGIDVSRYQGGIDWARVAAAGKQFAIVRMGSSNSNGLYVDPYFRQNVNGAHAAGLRVGAYYYTYARTEQAAIDELSLFLQALEGLRLEYPVFVDAEDASLAGLGRAQLTGLVRFAMDILYQRRYYAGWYSNTNFIARSLDAAALADYPLWVADYRAVPGHTGPYALWQYSSSGTVDGIAGVCDLDNSYLDFLPAIRAGGYNGYGAAGPAMEPAEGYQLSVFGSQTEYFYSPDFYDVVGYLPLGTYPVARRSTEKYDGYDWVVFRYNGGEYWTALLGDRNRLIAPNDDCTARLADANARINAAIAALEG